MKFDHQLTNFYSASEVKELDFVIDQLRKHEPREYKIKSNRKKEVAVFVRCHPYFCERPHKNIDIENEVLAV